MKFNAHCDRGHHYVQPDIPTGGWPEGIPQCPACRAELERKSIKIEDLQRIRLGPGDVLIIRLECPISMLEKTFLLEECLHVFPDNQVLILNRGDELVIIEKGETNETE